jgi:hypothetical protein
MEKEKAVV